MPPTRSTPPNERQCTYPKGHQTKTSRLNIQTFESLGYRDYRLLWLSVALSYTGASFKSVVIGWLIYNVTGSPFLTVIALAAASIPRLIAAPISGVFSDRLDRRRIIAFVSIYRVTVTLIFSIILVSNGAHTWQILIYVLGIGIGQSLEIPASTSYVTYTVPTRVLLNAFSLLSLAYNVAALIGPGIAGIILSYYGPGQTLWVAALFLITPAILVSMMKLTNPTVQTSNRRSTLSEIVDGVSLITRNPVVVALIITQVICYGIMVPSIYGLLPIYAVEIFTVGPGGLGVLNSSLGFGAIIGVLVTATIGHRLHKGMGALFILIGAGVTMIFFSQITSIYLAIVTLGLYHSLVASLTAIKSTVIQTLVPDNTRGRVAAITSMTNVVFPVGALIFGGIAEWQGAPTATIVGGISVLISTALLNLRYPQLRLFR